MQLRVHLIDDVEHVEDLAVGDLDVLPIPLMGDVVEQRSEGSKCPPRWPILEPLSRNRS